MCSINFIITESNELIEKIKFIKLIKQMDSVSEQFEAIRSTLQTTSNQEDRNSLYGKLIQQLKQFEEINTKIAKGYNAEGFIRRLIHYSQQHI